MSLKSVILNCCTYLFLKANHHFVIPSCNARQAREACKMPTKQLKALKNKKVPVNDDNNKNLSGHLTGYNCIPSFLRFIITSLGRDDEN